MKDTERTDGVPGGGARDCVCKGAERADKVRVGTRGHRVEDMSSDNYGLRLLGDSFGD